MSDDLREKDIASASGLRSFYECLNRDEKFPHTGHLHYHRYIEVLFCVKGPLTVICGQEQIDMVAGDMIYIAPNELHNLIYQVNDCKHYCIKIDPKLLTPVNIYNTASINNVILNHLKKYEFFKKEDYAESEYNLEKLFIDSIEIYKNEDYGSDLLNYSYILKIMSFIISMRSSINTIHINSPFVTKVDAYINENYPTVTLTQVADYMGMSYSHFSKTFTTHFGMNYTDYLNKVRIEKSIYMLKNSNDSITEIALQIGYTSTSHYIKTFKDITNTTPFKYRKHSI